MLKGSPFSLYVHIPFCEAKCTYCDFNSYAGQESLMAPYAEALVREATLWAPLMAGRRAETVFFGGGTPSLMPLEHMAQIMEALRSSFDLSGEAEVTLEANPALRPGSGQGSVDEAHLLGLRRLGVSRLSFGVQSFHDDELKQMERIHDGATAKAAYRAARAAGFENVNLDLIFGLVGQTMERWQKNLESAIELAPEHLSLYALTLEEGTPLTRDVARGRSAGPDPDLQADMFEWSRERLARAGYGHYEISNWARPGRECRHNLTYWRNGDWLGLGAGAHSHLFGERFAAAATPSRYIALVNETYFRRGSEGVQRTKRALSLVEEKLVSGYGDETLRQAQDAALRSAQGAPSAGLRTGQGRGAQGPDGRGGPGDPLRSPRRVFDNMRQVTYREAADERREMSETVILALRLREGLDVGSFRRRFGMSIEDVFGEALAETRALGLTEVVDGRLRLKDKAVLLGDEAFIRFLPDEAVVGEGVGGGAYGGTPSQIDSGCISG